MKYEILSQVQICKLRTEVRGLESCIGCPIAEEYGCSTQDDRFNQMCNITAANPDAFPDIEQREAERKAEYCGCDRPVRYFIQKMRGTFYWCGECIDYETVDLVLNQVRPDFEIGEYDGPPISCVNGSTMFNKQLNDLYCISQELAESDYLDFQSIADEIAKQADRLKMKLTPKDEKLCKHWIQHALLCGHDDMMFVEQKKSEDCSGLLANCKVPRYKLEQSR